MSKPEKNLDVVAINDRTDLVIWVDGPYDERNAEAVIKMAIMRQGVADRFFVTAPHGVNKAGEKPIRGNVEQPMVEPRGPRGLASQRGGE